MNLIELITYLVNPESLEEFYNQKKINTKSEALLIYMKNELDIKSDIAIFEIEETEDDLIFEKNGFQYIQLFPVDYSIELIESDLNRTDKALSNLEIAKRLLEYRIKDA